VAEKVPTLPLFPFFSHLLFFFSRRRSPQYHPPFQCRPPSLKTFERERIIFLFSPADISQSGVPNKAAFFESLPPPPYRRFSPFRRSLPIVSPLRSICLSFLPPDVPSFFPFFPSRGEETFSLPQRAESPFLWGGEGLFSPPVSKW